MQRCVSLGLPVVILSSLILVALVNGCGQGANTPSPVVRNAIVASTTSSPVVQASPSASPSASPPPPIVVSISPNGEGKFGIPISVGGGPPMVAELDTGSEALVVEQAYASGVALTGTSETAYYSHCRNGRMGTLGTANIAIMSNGQVVLKTIAPVPVLVVPNGNVGNESGNQGFNGIFGLRMCGSNGSTGANGAFISAKLFLPEPYNEMFVMDWPNHQMSFGRFNPADFNTVRLPAEACNTASTSEPPNPLPCWNDAAVPINYSVEPVASPQTCASPNPSCAVPSETVPDFPQIIPSLCDTGAGSSFQFNSTEVPTWLSVGCNEDVRNTVTASIAGSNGPVPIQLSSTIQAYGCTECNGNIVNAGNTFFNSFAVLYDQVDGMMGFQAASSPNP